MKMIDRIGQRFGRLQVVELTERRSSGGCIFWKCVCDCGSFVEVVVGNLTHGKTKSCGCLAREESSKRAKALFTQEPKNCLVDGCENNTKKGANGYCGKHYARVKRYGDHNHITSELQRRKNSRDSQKREAKPSTYKKYLGMHEHRYIASKILNRKLQTYEHVHHIDGNIHNNCPTNLAVLSRRDHLKLHKDLSTKGVTNVKFERLSEAGNCTNLRMDANQ